MASDAVPDLVEVCPLLTGAPACTCVTDAPELTDVQLKARIVTMTYWHYTSGAVGRAEVRRGLDALVSRMRERPVVYLETLYAALTTRLTEDSDVRSEANMARVDVLLRLYSELAQETGDPLLLGQLAVMRVMRKQAELDEDSLAEAAVAFAELTDPAALDGPTSPAVLDRTETLIRGLGTLARALVMISAFELVSDVHRQLYPVLREHGTPGQLLAYAYDRLRTNLAWAFRLERVGRTAAASARFADAATAARDAEVLWYTARGMASGEGTSAIEADEIIASTIALHRPGPDYLDMLAKVAPRLREPSDRVMHAVATARCLVAAGRAPEALSLLVTEQGSEPHQLDVAFTLVLRREIVTLERLVASSAEPVPAAVSYARTLEEELWTLRQARIANLRNAAAHHRLLRAHGAATVEALQDPLTGLPNRRALDLRLAEVARSADALPCAVALIDLDGFKKVNDEQSHAIGDGVLREVAAGLRATLRSQDLVARYGGDEFVVVLPRTPLADAVTVLSRTRDAVAALPDEVAWGVTLSIGLAPVRPGADVTAALHAADAAMYRAKRRGGSQVAVDHGVDSTG